MAYLQSHYHTQFQFVVSIDGLTVFEHMSRVQSEVCLLNNIHLPMPLMKITGIFNIMSM